MSLQKINTNRFKIAMMGQVRVVMVGVKGNVGGDVCGFPIGVRVHTNELRAERGGGTSG